MSDRARYDENQELRAKIKQLEEENKRLNKLIPEIHKGKHMFCEHNRITNLQLLKIKDEEIEKQQKVIDKIKKSLVEFYDDVDNKTFMEFTQDVKDALAQLEKKE